MTIKFCFYHVSGLDSPFNYCSANNRKKLNVLELKSENLILRDWMNGRGYDRQVI
jgi:hypothetical protein